MTWHKVVSFYAQPGLESYSFTLSDKMSTDTALAAAVLNQNGGHSVVLYGTIIYHVRTASCSWFNHFQLQLSQ